MWKILLQSNHKIGRRRGHSLKNEHFFEFPKSEDIIRLARSYKYTNYCRSSFKPSKLSFSVVRVLYYINNSTNKWNNKTIYYEPAFGYFYLYKWSSEMCYNYAVDKTIQPLPGSVCSKSADMNIYEFGWNSLMGTEPLSWQRRHGTVCALVNSQFIVVM